MIKFNAEYAHGLVPLISKDKMKPHFQGLYIEPHQSGDGVYLVATDGHAMGVFYDREGECDEPTLLNISKETAKQLKPSRTVVFEAAKITVNGNFEEPIYTERGYILDSNWPLKWRELISKFPNNHVPGAFNRRLLAKFKNVGSYKSDPMSVYGGGDPRTPALVFIQDQPNFLGVISPIYCDPHIKLPGWLD